MANHESLSAYDVAQEGLVSSLLYLPGRVSEVASLVDPEDFANGRLQTVYKAMLEINEENQIPDFAHVVARLDKTAGLAQAGGVEEVSRLFTDGALNGSMSTVEQYARTVKNAASKNRSSKILSEAAGKAAAPKGSAKTIIEDTRSKLDDELMTLVTDSNTISVKDYFDEYLEDLKAAKTKYEETGGDPLAAEGGIPSGFPTIDKYVGGWLPGQVAVVGARTGVGKTFFLVSAALNAAQAGAPVLFCSLEMKKKEIMNRLVSANSTVRLSALGSGALSSEELAKVAASRKEVEDLPITIDSTPDVTIDYIRAKAQQMASSPTGLGLVIVDYLQLITPSRHGAGGNREREVAEISRGLKLLSMKLSVPVLVAVQLNRPHKGDEDPIPSKDDIRESNAIAQDASAIIILHRDLKQNEGKDPTLFIIDKNRNGASGKRFRCQTMLNYSKFVEISNSDEDGLDDAVALSGDADGAEGQPAGPTAAPSTDSTQSTVTDHMFEDEEDDDF